MNIQVSDYKKIGIFDSGIGGLSIVKHLESTNLSDIIYCADTAFMPYGSKEPATIQERSLYIAHYLISQNVDAIIIACHTASAHALTLLENSFDIPFIGVIEPTAHDAATTTKNNKIGVIATPATVLSNTYPYALQKYNQNAQVFMQSCPTLAPLIEQNPSNADAIKVVAHQYLLPLLQQNIDTLILGSTHYALIKELIQEITGPDVSLIAAGESIKKMIRIKENKYACKYSFLTTGDVQTFANSSALMLGWQPEDIMHLAPKGRTKIERYKQV